MRRSIFAPLFIVLLIIVTACASRSDNPPAAGGAAQGSASPGQHSPAPASGTPAAPGASAVPSASDVPSAGPTGAAPKAGKPSTAPVPPDKAKRAYPDIPIEHIVIVVEENHSYDQIVGNKKAPYMQSLIERGALFTNATAITHPSQPNYFALFSGSTQKVKDDSCKGPFTAPNLATELANAKLTFAGYSEQQPSAGYTGCTSKGYARKHNPWAQFTNVSKQQNLPFTEFPKDLSSLPTVSFVIPAGDNDMHDGTVQMADDWLKKNIDGYVKWANEHNSLLILTWDEDDFSPKNHIPVIFAGPMVKPGKYADAINHYNVLRTIEDVYGLGQLGETKNAKGIATVWK